MKLLIVDDHPTMRAGLAVLLAQLGTEIEVLEARSGAEGLALAQEHPELDAVFVDLMMPGMDGMTAVQEFVRRHPQLPVIVLSSSEDAQDVRRALGYGALGYIPKSADPQTILSAFQLVMSGNMYVPPLLLQSVPAATGEAAIVQGSDSASRSTRLTGRQTSVLELLCKGLSNKEICRQLDLSDSTVKAHVSAIFKALNVVNRTQAVRAAQAAGIAG
jgi:two-component system nitrate/nitrite response regulator NarL